MGAFRTARRARAFILAILGALAGGVLAISLAGSASASSPWVWDSYNLSSEAGGTAATGAPFMIPDPNGYTQDEVTDSPSADTLVWTGDGGTGGRGLFNITTMASGPAASGSPTAIYEPTANDLTIFTNTSNGDLLAYTRAASGAFSAYNVTQNVSGGSTIAGNPSAAIETSHTLDVAADTSSNSLVVFSRVGTGGWSEANVTSATNQAIVGDPAALTDPNGDYLDVFTSTSAGHLIDFSDQSGKWQSSDLTSQWGGGQTITSEPTPVVDGSDVYVFTSADGDLIAWERSAADDGEWSSTNLTGQPQLGQPTVVGKPAAVVESNGTIDVFAANSNEHLIEYTDTAGAWTATDLTADDGAPTIASPPGAAISTSTGNLVVTAVSPANDLVEVERTPAPASSSTTAVTTTVTQTIASTPPATARRQVRVKLLTGWTWSRTESTLVWVRLGRITRGEGLSLACTGTDRHKAIGCPFRLLRATGPRSVHRLEARIARTRYRVGVRLTVAVSEPRLRPEVATFRIRSGRVPKVIR